jgi:hypothetical protein
MWKYNKSINAPFKTKKLLTPAHKIDKADKNDIFKIQNQKP